MIPTDSYFAEGWLNHQRVIYIAKAIAESSTNRDQIRHQPAEPGHCGRRARGQGRARFSAFW